MPFVVAPETHRFAMCVLVKSSNMIENKCRFTFRDRISVQECSHLRTQHIAPHCSERNRGYDRRPYSSSQRSSAYRLAAEHVLV